MKDKSYKRHIAKTITWRLVGTIDTILLAWVISGNPYTAFKIGSAEVISKLVLYYLHERFWFKVRIWAGKKGDESKKRHLTKTVSWRLVGTLDTFILAWFISGSPVAGLQIGVAEVITKMFLYYLHERAWYRLNYGLSGRTSKTMGK